MAAATATIKTMMPTAIPILAPVDRPELADVEAWLEVEDVAEAAATAVSWFEEEIKDNAVVEVSRLLATALVATASDEVVEKVDCEAGVEALLTKMDDVLGTLELAGSDVEVVKVNRSDEDWVDEPPEKSMMLVLLEATVEAASGSPTCVACVLLDSDSTPIVV